MFISRRHWIMSWVYAAVTATLFAGSLGLTSPAHANSEKITVFAAASMKNALDAANAAWLERTGTAISVSYAASSTLAKQIEQGAPADIFIAADLDWMNYLAERHLIRPETRSDLLGNRLVLIATGTKPQTVDLASGVDLAGLLGSGRLAMGHVDSVPAGKYGKAALESLGLWSSVKDKIAASESVRAALLLVSRCEAPLGIVYQTDAAADKGVTVIGTFPESSHPPIIYPIAQTTQGTSEKTAAYLDFLRSDTARPFFEAQGFVVLK